jgi:polyhydroxybutyrate depolymerase
MGFSTTKLFSVALLSIAWGYAPAQGVAAKAPGRFVEHIRSGGLDREFILDVPPGYDGSKPTPVVVVLHGWTATDAEAEIYTRMAEEGNAKGFVSVFPNGEGPKNLLGWNTGFMNLTGINDLDDVGFVSDVLDEVEKEINTDKDREFVCGHSNGAFLSNLIGAKLSDRIAAIGSVAGTIGFSGPTGKKIPSPAGPISVILIHGKADEMVAYGPGSPALLKGVVGAVDSAKWWASIDGCSATPEETVSPNGNVITDLYSNGRRGTEVELVSIVNGSHTWPGGFGRDSKRLAVPETTTGVNAADVLWGFFQSHPRKHQ